MATRFARLHGKKDGEPAMHEEQAGHTPALPAPPGSKLDPVCGMTVKAEPPPERRAEHGGETYWFCGAGCQRKFVADPARYLKPVAPAPKPSVVAGRLYTCPMHPEIQQMGFGSCPICGMALEPAEVTDDEGPNPELVDMSRRFWVSVAFTVPLLGMAMGEMALHAAFARVGSMIWVYVQLALATPVVVWGGAPFFVRGWQSVRTRNLNMFTLIAMGTGTAFGFSVVATFFPELLPHAMAPFRRATGLFRSRLRSSRRSSCSGRCSSCALGVPRAARSGPSLAWTPKQAPSEFVTTARKRTSRSATYTRVLACASVQASGCPWTAWCSKGRAQSTSR